METNMKMVETMMMVVDFWLPFFTVIISYICVFLWGKLHKQNDSNSLKDSFKKLMFYGVIIITMEMVLFKYIYEISQLLQI